MDKVLTWFFWLWVTLAVLVNVVSILGLMMTADDLAQGWQRVTDIYNPFNVVNFIAEVVLISPAVGAYLWREHRRKRRAPKA